MADEKVYYSALWANLSDGEIVTVGGETYTIGTDAFNDYGKAVASGKQVQDLDTYYNAEWSSGDTVTINARGGSYSAVVSDTASANTNAFTTQEVAKSAHGSYYPDGGIVIDGVTITTASRYNLLASQEYPYILKNYQYTSTSGTNGIFFCDQSTDTVHGGNIVIGTGSSIYNAYTGYYGYSDTSTAKTTGKVDVKIVDGAEITNFYNGVLWSRGYLGDNTETAETGFSTDIHITIDHATVKGLYGAGDGATTYANVVLDAVSTHGKFIYGSSSRSLMGYFTINLTDATYDTYVSYYMIGQTTSTKGAFQVNALGGTNTVGTGIVLRNDGNDSITINADALLITGGVYQTDNSTAYTGTITIDATDFEFGDKKEKLVYRQTAQGINANFTVVENGENSTQFTTERDGKDIYLTYLKALVSGAWQRYDNGDTVTVDGKEYTLGVDAFKTEKDALDAGWKDTKRVDIFANAAWAGTEDGQTVYAELFDGSTVAATFGVNAFADAKSAGSKATSKGYNLYLIGDFDEGYYGCGQPTVFTGGFIPAIYAAQMSTSVAELSILGGTVNTTRAFSGNVTKGYLYIEGSTVTGNVLPGSDGKVSTTTMEIVGSTIGGVFGNNALTVTDAYNLILKNSVVVNSVWVGTNSGSNLSCFYGDVNISLENSTVGDAVKFSNRSTSFWAGAFSMTMQDINISLTNSQVFYFDTGGVTPWNAVKSLTLTFNGGTTRQGSDLSQITTEITAGTATFVSGGTVVTLEGAGGSIKAYGEALEPGATVAGNVRWVGGTATYNADGSVTVVGNGSGKESRGSALLYIGDKYYNLQNGESVTVTGGTYAKKTIRITGGGSSSLRAFSGIQEIIIDAGSYLNMEGSIACDTISVDVTGYTGGDSCVVKLASMSWTWNNLQAVENGEKSKRYTVKKNGGYEIYLYERFTFFAGAWKDLSDGDKVTVNGKTYTIGTDAFTTYAAAVESLGGYIKNAKIGDFFVNGAWADGETVTVTINEESFDFVVNATNAFNNFADAYAAYTAAGFADGNLTVTSNVNVDESVTIGNFTLDAAAKITFADGKVLRADTITIDATNYSLADNERKLLIRAAATIAGDYILKQTDDDYYLSLEGGDLYLTHAPVYYSALWADKQNGDTVTVDGKSYTIGIDAFNNYNAANEAALAKGGAVRDLDTYFNASWSAGQVTTIHARGGNYYALVGDAAKSWINAYTTRSNAEKAHKNEYPDGGIVVTGGTYTARTQLDTDASTPVIYTGMTSTQSADQATMLFKGTARGVAGGGYAVIGGSSSINTLLIAPRNDSFVQGEIVLKVVDNAKISALYLGGLYNGLIGNPAEKDTAKTTTVTVTVCGASVGTIYGGGYSSQCYADVTINAVNTTGNYICGSATMESDRLYGDMTVNLTGSTYTRISWYASNAPAGLYGKLTVNVVAGTSHVTDGLVLRNTDALTIKADAYLYTRSITLANATETLYSGTITVDATGYEGDRRMFFQTRLGGDYAFAVAGNEKYKVAREAIDDGYGYYLQAKVAYFAGDWKDLADGTDVHAGNETVKIGEYAFKTYAAAQATGYKMSVGDFFVNDTWEDGKTVTVTVNDENIDFVVNDTNAFTSADAAYNAYKQAAFSDGSFTAETGTHTIDENVSVKHLTVGSSADLTTNDLTATGDFTLASGAKLTAGVMTLNNVDAAENVTITAASISAATLSLAHSASVTLTGALTATGAVTIDATGLELAPGASKLVVAATSVSAGSFVVLENGTVSDKYVANVKQDGLYLQETGVNIVNTAWRGLAKDTVVKTAYGDRTLGVDAFASFEDAVAAGKSLDTLVTMDANYNTAWTAGETVKLAEFDDKTVSAVVLDGNACYLYNNNAYTSAANATANKNAYAIAHSYGATTSQTAVAYTTYDGRSRKGMVYDQASITSEITYGNNDIYFINSTLTGKIRGVSSAVTSGNAINYYFDNTKASSYTGLSGNYTGSLSIDLNSYALMGDEGWWTFDTNLVLVNGSSITTLNPYGRGGDGNNAWLDVHGSFNLTIDNSYVGSINNTDEWGTADFYWENGFNVDVRNGGYIATLRFSNKGANNVSLDGGTVGSLTYLSNRAARTISGKGYTYEREAVSVGTVTFTVTGGKESAVIGAFNLRAADAAYSGRANADNLSISEASTLRASDKMTNAGSITIDGASALNVATTFDNSGVITIDGASELTSGKAMTNTGSITIDVGSLLITQGALTNSGTITIDADGYTFAPDSVAVKVVDAGSAITSLDGYHLVNGTGDNKLFLRNGDVWYGDDKVIYFSDNWKDLADDTVVDVDGGTHIIGTDAFFKYADAETAAKGGFPLKSPDNFYSYDWVGKTGPQTVIYRGGTFKALISDANADIKLYDSLASAITATGTTGTLLITGGSTSISGRTHWDAGNIVVTGTTITKASSFQGTALSNGVNGGTSTFTVGKGADIASIAFGSTTAITGISSTINVVDGGIVRGIYLTGNNGGKAAEKMYLNVDGGVTGPVSFGPGSSYESDADIYINVSNGGRTSFQFRANNGDGVITIAAGRTVAVTLDGSTITSMANANGALAKEDGAKITLDVYGASVIGDANNKMVDFDTLTIHIGETASGLTVGGSFNYAGTITVDVSDCQYTQKRYLILASPVAIGTERFVINDDSSKNYSIKQDGNNVYYETNNKVYFSVAWEGLTDGTEVTLGSETLTIGETAFADYGKAAEYAETHPVLVASADIYLNSTYNATDPIEIPSGTATYTATFGADAFNSVSAAVGAVQAGGALRVTGGTFSPGTTSNRTTFSVANFEVADTSIGNSLEGMTSSYTGNIKEVVRNSTIGNYFYATGDKIGGVTGNIDVTLDNVDVGFVAKGARSFIVSAGTVTGNVNVAFVNGTKFYNDVYVLNSGTTVFGDVNVTLGDVEINKKGLCNYDGTITGNSTITVIGDAKVSSIKDFNTVTIDEDAALRYGRCTNEKSEWEDKYLFALNDLVNNGTFYYNAAIGQNAYHTAVNNYSTESTGTVSSEVGNVIFANGGTTLYAAEVQKSMKIDSALTNKKMFDEVETAGGTYFYGVSAFATTGEAIGSVLSEENVTSLDVQTGTYGNLDFQGYNATLNGVTAERVSASGRESGTQTIAFTGGSVGEFNATTTYGDITVNINKGTSEFSTFTAVKTGDASLKINAKDGVLKAKEFRVTGGTFASDTGGNTNINTDYLEITDTTINNTLNINPFDGTSKNVTLKIVNSKIGNGVTPHLNITGDLNILVENTDIGKKGTSVGALYGINSGSVGGNVNITINGGEIYNGLYATETGTSVTGNVNVTLGDCTLGKSGVYNAGKVEGDLNIIVKGDAVVSTVNRASKATKVTSPFKNIEITESGTLSYGKNALDPSWDQKTELMAIDTLVNNGTFNYNAAIGQNAYHTAVNNYSGDGTISSTVGNVVFTVNGTVYAAEVQERMMIDATLTEKSLFDKVTIGGVEYIYGISAFRTKEEAISAQVYDSAASTLVVVGGTETDVIHGNGHIEFNGSTVTKSVYAGQEISEGTASADSSVTIVGVAGKDGVYSTLVGGNEITGDVTQSGNSAVTINGENNIAGKAVIASSYVTNGTVTFDGCTSTVMVESGSFSGIVTGGALLNHTGAATGTLTTDVTVKGGVVKAVIGGCYLQKDANDPESCKISIGEQNAPSSTNVTISGGTILLHVFGGNAGKTPDVSTERSSAWGGSTSVTIDAREQFIYIGGNVIAGSDGKGTIAKGTTLTFKGDGKNLSIGGHIVGDSASASDNAKGVTGTRSLIFDHFNGTLGSSGKKVTGFDAVSLTGSTVTLPGYGKLVPVSEWTITDSTLIWGKGANSFAGDKLYLSYTGELTDEWTVFQLADGLTTDWDAFTTDDEAEGNPSIGLKIGDFDGFAYAYWDDDLKAYATSVAEGQNYKFYLDEDNALKVAKLA